MIINQHVLVHSPLAGNGYHGNCEHCGLPLVTDLGYTSWAGVKCVDREITNWNDIPKDIKEYAAFRGYKWNPTQKVFAKPTFSEHLDNLTIDQMHERMVEIQSHEQK